jgi:hypothetical protein
VGFGFLDSNLQASERIEAGNSWPLVESSCLKASFRFLHGFLGVRRKEPDPALLERFDHPPVKKVENRNLMRRKTHHTIVHDLAANFVGRGSTEGNASPISTNDDAR